MSIGTQTGAAASAKAAPPLPDGHFIFARFKMFFSLLSIWALSKVHFDMQTKTLYKISGEEEAVIEKIRSYTDSSSYLRKSKIEAVQRAKPMKLEVDLGLKANETISSLMKKTYSSKLWLYLPPFSPGGFVKYRLRKLYSVWVPSSQPSDIWTLSSPAGALGGWRPLLCGYFVSYMGNTDSIYSYIIPLTLNLNGYTWLYIP